MLYQIDSCSICGSKEIQEAISLPGLPLTGLYYPELNQALNSPTFDQGLSICSTCGHCQLSNYIEPSIVYDDSYTHRTSSSPLSTKGNDFLFEYIINNVAEDDATSILEAGCNDCYLLKKLRQHYPKSDLYGFDPIWIGNRPDFPSLHIYGSYVEHIGSNLPNISPGLVLSAHTFEHVVDLHDSLAGLVAIAKTGARLIIEMPSFDTLLRLSRFDQIFHQHVQYISESSIHYLLSKLGCSLNNIAYNFNYWGGTVIFDFTKNGLTYKRTNKKKYTKEDILSSYHTFKQNVATVRRSIPDPDDVSILGAAQMLPILYYHTKDFFGFSRILDDNRERVGNFLPNTPLPIESLSQLKASSSSTASFVIGAIDSSRSLISRTKQLGIPNVFSFFNCCI